MAFSVAAIYRSLGQAGMSALDGEGSGASVSGTRRELVFERLIWILWV